MSRDNGGRNEAGHDGAETPIVALTTDASEGIDMADSHSSKSPAFQFYPKDFITDKNVRPMSLQELGAYIRLICFCWMDGSLPSSPDELAVTCGVPAATFRKVWPAVEKCFKATADGSRLVHPRLETERQKQRAFKRRQADNGKLGGRPSKTQKNPSLSTINPSLSQPTNPRESFAFTSSSSSSDFSQKPTSVRVDEISERAGRFCTETYPDLYAKFRKGARYVSKPALDFQEALQLCRTWDDERLVKIATVFLTTDHEFAEKGSRTMAQFRSLASWCDSRLAEAGIA